MLRRVGKPLMASEGIPSESALLPFVSPRLRFRRYTPEKMIKKPQSSEIVFTADVVLKPWKSRQDAMRVNVVKVT